MCFIVTCYVEPRGTTDYFNVCYYFKTSIKNCEVGSPPCSKYERPRLLKPIFLLHMLRGTTLNHLLLSYVHRQIQHFIISKLLTKIVRLGPYPVPKINVHDNSKPTDAERHSFLLFSPRTFPDGAGKGR